MQFAEHVLPASAPPIQRQETRRAFYAGAAWLFGEMTTGLAEDTEPTDADMAKMEMIHGEIRGWLTDMEEGRA